MLKVIHVAAGALLSITPVPPDDPNYTIIYLDPPPPSSFVIEQLPSFHFFPNAPLGVAYGDGSVEVILSKAPPPSRDRDLNCSDMTEWNITNLGSDPHRLDGDGDGIGCER
jgi:hypothetical protein